jgi:spore germination protein YaaH
MNSILPKIDFYCQKGLEFLLTRKQHVALSVSIVGAIVLLLIVSAATPLKALISPLTHSSLHPLAKGKSTKEVFGFAPYWTFNNLDNVDFSTLTTFSYFGVPVNPDGTLDTTDQGYQTFVSDKATRIFQKAHSYGTRVVLTITQMNNPSIEAFLGDPAAQSQAIDNVVSTVKNRGIDGINVDFEYTGDPGVTYRNAFSAFVSTLTTRMHAAVPESKVTVSVYALAAKDPKLTDIHALSQSVDGIFMMAYDFATSNSDIAMPTAPLYGKAQGAYSYDVSTAVNDFLAVMPASKLILGVPYYGYNYSVYTPAVHAATAPYWYGQAAVQTYAIAQENDTPTRSDITSFKTGWDNAGQVGYKAYRLSNGEWRIIFLEDTKSLGLKYDYALSKNLAGVGIWALGFDNGKQELWSLLENKFGTKFADSRIVNKQVAFMN